MLSSRWSFQYQQLECFGIALWRKIGGSQNVPPLNCNNGTASIKAKGKKKNLCE